MVDKSGRRLGGGENYRRGLSRIHTAVESDQIACSKKNTHHYKMMRAINTSNDQPDYLCVGKLNIVPSRTPALGQRWVMVLRLE